MKSTVLAQLAELERLSHASLKQRWRELFGSDPPAYSQRLLIQRLAYRIQELAYGGLPPDARTRMEELVRNAKSETKPSRSNSSKEKEANAKTPPPGTRLVREFKEKRYEVVVGESGFEFKGRRYRSLSAIAREITGTQWSGPSFFGLKEKRGKRTKGAAR